MFAGAAFTDSADIKSTEAVDTLTALGVIDGFEDGSFQPNGTVTRAQMAKMIYVARTGNANADSYKSATTSFTDVNNHWAAGFVKYCQANGIIAGKSATKFDPDATVTGVEAAKMLLVTMGYQPAQAGLTGAGWDQKTIGLASENKLLDDVNADLYSALPRQYAAQVIYNTLNADRVVWSTDANGFDWYTDRGGDRETVGQKYLDLTTYEATLTATGKWGTSKDHMIISDIKKINNNSLSTPAGPKTLDFSEDLSDMMYQRVKVMTGKNDKVLGVYTLDDSVVTANTADVGTDGAKIKIDGTKYSLQGDNVNVYANGADTAVAMTASAFKSAYQYTGSVVTFSDTGDNGKYDTAVVTKPTVGKVTSVSSASIVAGGKTYKFADDNIVDGLKKDDYAVVVPNLFNDNNDITKADVVEGAYNGVKSREVRVADNWYKTSVATSTLMSGISSGNTVQLFVANGVAFNAKKITGTGSGEPDMALFVESGSFKQARVMFADGTIKTVDLDSSVDEAGNPLQAGTLYEFSVKDGKYKFETPQTNVDYTYVSNKILTEDSSHKIEKFDGNPIDDNAVVLVYSAHETDAKKITGKQLKSLGLTSGNITSNAYGYTSKVNGMVKATYLVVTMTTGKNLPNNFDTNDNYGYIVKDAYKDGDYSVYKVWTGTETVEVREEVTYPTPFVETSTNARLKGDVIGYSTIETKEGELPEIKDVTRYSLAVAGTTLQVGGVSGSTSSKVAIDGANEYDLTKDTVILNVNSSADTKEIGLTGTELFEADDYKVGTSTKYVPNALYLLDGDDIEAIVVDANVIKNTYAAKVASIAATVTVEDRNGDAVEAGDYVVANEVLTIKNDGATAVTLTLGNATDKDGNTSVTVPAHSNVQVYVSANANVTIA